MACKSNKKMADFTSDQAAIESLAKEKYKGPFVIFPSEKHDYSLVTSRTKTLKMLFPTVHFFVYDHKTDKILIEDDLIGGSVRWTTTHEIEATRRGQGTDLKNGRHSYVYNCRTNEWFEE